MFVIIGIVVVMGCMLGGFIWSGGDPRLLVQPSEFLVIIGCVIGAMLVGNPLPAFIRIITGAIGTLKGPAISKQAYIDLLKMLYEIFQFAKREGLIALEPHVENPESSSIMSKYTTFINNHHAVDFLCDTLKVLLSGGVPAHDLDDLMDADLETLHHFEHGPTASLTTAADAFPAIGIVAAVLGIIVTMMSISEGPEVVGHHVGAALVGTFTGVLLSYCIVGPIAQIMGTYASMDGKYVLVIKAAVLAYAKGSPANVAIEFGRRVIDPTMRPSFKETEEACKR
ncbi:MAG: flagellar motor stator protein MotA [Bacteroidetes bacterium]|nr:flagellar motor stator protein MotA [Bacteroidota bacterium]